MKKATVDPTVRGALVASAELLMAGLHNSGVLNCDRPFRNKGRLSAQRRAGLPSWSQHRWESECAKSGSDCAANGLQKKLTGPRNVGG